MLYFGLGKLYLMAADGEMIEFADLQDVSVGISYDYKELKSSNLFANNRVRTGAKIDCKASYANIHAKGLALHTGGTVSTGRKEMQTKIVTTTNAQVQVLIGTEAIAFENNLSVFDITDANNPIAIEEYTVTKLNTLGYQQGQYDFTGDITLKTLLFSYEAAVLTGKTITVNNQVAAAAPTFMAIIYNVTGDAGFGIKLFKCTSSKLDFAFKDDFSIPNFDFTAMANAIGKVFEVYLSE